MKKEIPDKKQNDDESELKSKIDKTEELVRSLKEEFTANLTKIAQSGEVNYKKIEESEIKI